MLNEDNPAPSHAPFIALAGVCLDGWRRVVLHDYKPCSIRNPLRFFLMDGWRRDLRHPAPSHAPLIALRAISWTAGAV